MWITPRKALERGERGEIELVLRDAAHAADLRRFADRRARRSQYARALPRSRRTAPAARMGKEGAKVFRRSDPQYFEIHWSDPEETGADDATTSSPASRSASTAA